MARRKPMPATLKRKIYLIAGFFFLILGILGVFLPILQGVLFLLVALVFFSKGSARVRLLRRRFRQRYPQWGGKLDAAEKWAQHLPGRIKRKLGGGRQRQR